MNKSLQYRPDYATSPGETLLEALKERGMTQAELARRIDRPTKTVNQIIKGKTAITAETSIQLETVLHIPAEFWTNREARYREVLARRARQSSLMAEVGCLWEFPYAELVKLGKIQATSNSEEKVACLRSFFGVDSLSNLANVYGVSLRVARTRQPSSGALMAWLRMGELAAQEIPEVAEFNATRLRNQIGDLRALTLLEPGLASVRLRGMLAGCGVRIVYVQHLPKTYAHGATWWRSDAPIIQLSARGSYEDILWFSLFHELGHVLLGHSRKTILIAWDGEENKDDLERDADQFAANTLMRPSDYVPFTQKGVFSEGAVRKFAAQVGVCPGIVVGRLQHDSLLPHTHLSGLRRKLRIQAEG
jgi:addiction module HigA family antidote